MSIDYFLLFFILSRLHWIYFCLHFKIPFRKSYMHTNVKCWVWESIPNVKESTSNQTAHYSFPENFVYIYRASEHYLLNTTAFIRMSIRKCNRYPIQNDLFTKAFIYFSLLLAIAFCVRMPLTQAKLLESLLLSIYTFCCRRFFYNQTKIALPLLFVNCYAHTLSTFLHTCTKTGYLSPQYYCRYREKQKK